MQPSDAVASQEGFTEYVDKSTIKSSPDTPSKKAVFKSFEEINSLLVIGRKSDVKKIVRESAWPAENAIRSKLWQALCLQHAKDPPAPSYYWDTVQELYGSTGKPIKYLKTFILPGLG